MDWKARAKALKIQIPAIFLALSDAQTPFLAKALAGLTVAYALSPIDLVPDFIPVLGYLDDLLILPGLAALTIRLIPPAVMARCQEKAQGLWAGGRPRRWYYALPVLALWLLIVWCILKAFLR